MINPEYFTIAIEKAASQQQRQELLHIQTLAEQLFKLEQDFPRKLAKAKQRRGETMEKVDNEYFESLGDIDEDINSIDKEQIRYFRSAKTPQEILSTLTYQMPGVDLGKEWMLPQMHAEDRPLLEEIINLEKEIETVMNTFLEKYP
jgi:hypothetical protein